MTIDGGRTLAKQPAQLPFWLSLLIIIICLGAGGWFLWETFSSRQRSIERIVLDSDPQTRPADTLPAPQPFNPRAFSGPGGQRIWRSQRSGQWYLRTGSISVVVNRDSTAGYTFDGRWNDYNFLPSSSRLLLELRRDVLFSRGGDMGSTLKISPEQMKQLQDMGEAGRPQLSSVAVAELGALWEQYARDSSPEHAEALLDRLETHAQTIAEGLQPVAQERAEQVARIVTPQQMQAYRDIRYPRPPRPTTAPSTRDAAPTTQP